jgi:enoyl-CoA hydratase
VSEVVTYTADGRVGIITLDRPEARNAVNGELATGVEAALDDFEADDGIQAVVITGNGPTFSAGADLKLIAAGRGAEMATARGNFAGLVRRDFPKPIIAAVNGAAFAGGFEIVLACDLVVAAEEAQFGIPEVKRGLFAAAGALIRLPKRIPLALATELAITGDPIDAHRALQLGLVSRVVPLAEVVDAALELAARIAANGPLAVRKTLQMVREAGDLTEEEAWPRNFELAMEVFASKDSIEGATAFAEKRPPRWTGT